MKAADKLEIVNVTAAVLLMMLFGYTALSKILDYEKFIFQMQLAPVPLMASFAPVLGGLVIIIELLIVVCLSQEKWRMKGLYASLLLLLSFEIYITAMLFSGSKLPCTCGGIISQMGWKTHLRFNALFMFFAVVPIILNHRTKQSKTLNIRRINLRE